MNTIIEIKLQKKRGCGTILFYFLILSLAGYFIEWFANSLAAGIITFILLSILLILSSIYNFLFNYFKLVANTQSNTVVLVRSKMGRIFGVKTFMISDWNAVSLNEVKYRKSTVTELHYKNKKICMLRVDDEAKRLSNFLHQVIHK